MSSAASTTAVAAYSSSLSSSISAARKKRMVYGSDDVLFGHIEDQQGTKPFGSFLDAGTGLHSLRWIATLGGGDGDGDCNDDDNNKNNSKTTRNNSMTTMTDFTAVTADETMRRNCQREVDELGISHLGKVVIGNWFPPNGGDDKQSLSMIDKDENGDTKLYDTIVADYLIGAMDGFSPFTQDQMIDKLAHRLKPGGRLYIAGLQPIPDSYGGGKNKNSPQNIICEVRKVRDACILLSGDRCYREYPLEWIERQITGGGTTTGDDEDDKEKENNNNDDNILKLIDSKEFPILYRHSTIVKQINVARNKLPRFPSKALAKEMEKVLDELAKRSYDATEKISPGKRIQLGFDYVVTAERTMPKEQQEIETNSVYD